ncbi:calmodulin, partial [Trypanosoma cruzi]
MSRQEMTESIEQLESDLRALDRERSGFIPCEDFKVVLLRNGGSLAQVEALTEQFKVEGRGSVRYAALLDSMKQLAECMNSSLLARDDDDSFGRRSASRFSDESDMKKGAIAAGISHERPQPYVISQVASCAEKSANYDSHHGAFKSGGDDKRNETFY